MILNSKKSHYKWIIRMKLKILFLATHNKSYFGINLSFIYAFHISFHLVTAYGLGDTISKALISALLLIVELAAVIIYSHHIC